MAIKQLSVLAENEKGSLKKITGALKENGIDLRSICVADTENYGIIRIVADDTKKAEKALSEAGFTAKTKEVVAAAIPDRPGGLDSILSLFDDNGIDLEYMYSIISSHKGDACMVLRVDDNEKAEKLLADNGIRVLNENDI